MKTKELIAELERLDAKATKGPWYSGAECEDEDPTVWAWIEERRGDCVVTELSDFLPGWENNRRLIIFSGTHRTEIVANLKMFEEAKALLSDIAGQFSPAMQLSKSVRDFNVFEKITAFLEKAEQ